MKQRIQKLLAVSVLAAVLTAAVLGVPELSLAADRDTALANDPDPYIRANPQPYNTANLTLTPGLTYTKGGKQYEVTGAIDTMSFSADPTCIEANGRIYVYGTLDQRSYAKSFNAGGGAINPSNDPANGMVIGNIYQTRKLAVFSSADLVNWTDEGYIDLNQVKSDSGVPAGSKWAWNSWAPTAMKYDCDGDGEDEYYIFFTNGGNVGYIKGETPTGPWKDELGDLLIVKEKIPNGMGNGIVWNFDPAVFADDDGQAYIYWGGGVPQGQATHPKTSRACRLKILPNKVELDWSTLTELDAYYMFEDNEINKFQGKYVYSYCANWDVPRTDKYIEDGAAVSINAYIADDPLHVTSDPANPAEGDPVFLGTFLKNPGAELFDEWYNNHHHMFEFKGKYYILYHTTALDQFLYKDFYAAANRKSMSYRNLHIDEIRVDVAGENPSIRIQPTYKGPDQVQNFDPYQVINATTQSHQGGLTRAVLNDGTVVLDKIDTGDWIRIDGVDFGENGAQGLKASISSETAEGSVEVYLDEALTGTRIATLPLVYTGSGAYQTVAASLDRVTGVHDVYFVFRGSGYRVAAWEFTAGEVEPTSRPETQPGTEHTEPIELDGVPMIQDLKVLGNKKIKVSLDKAVANADGYVIRYSLKKSMTSAEKATIKDQAKLSRTISGLKAGKVYYVQVRAYKIVDGKKYYSKWSGKKKVTVK